MKKRVIALGFFDGVHLGHGALLKQTLALAKTYGASSAALTFHIHPEELIHGKPILLLNTLSEREYLVKTLYGIEELLPLTFDEQRMSQPWQDFIDQTLIEEYHGVHVVCGYDFRFGAGGRGNTQVLKEYCTEKGIGCDIIPPVILNGDRVSSTRIRGLVETGRMEEAYTLLGHPHILQGKVVAGRAIGRTLGIPTANLEPNSRRLLPSKGVYAAKAYWENQCHLAVVNIGTRPTVEGSHITIEPWILDFSGDLYEKELTLALYAFLRPEKKFPDLVALQQEILRNAEETREYFKTHPI